MLALVQAAKAYDGERGASFATYASLRIRGALVDELRGLDWATRSVRRRARQVDDARGQISTALGRPAEQHEVAAALGIGVGELDAHRDDLARASVMSLQAFEQRSVDDLLPAQTVTPAEIMEQRERVAYLHDAVEQLPERLRTVVRSHFFEDRPMAQIAERLGVSESRVSQLRAEAVVLHARGPGRRSGPGARRAPRAARRMRGPPQGDLLRQCRRPPQLCGPAVGPRVLATGGVGLGSSLEPHQRLGDAPAVALGEAGGPDPAAASGW